MAVTKSRFACLLFLWRRCPLTAVGDEYPANNLLDRALKEDTLDHGYVSERVSSESARLMLTKPC